MSLYRCAIHRYSGPLACSNCSNQWGTSLPVERFTVVGFVAATEIIAELTADRDALRARVAELERLGNELAGHVRNCGGCIGCDEAHAAWRAARKP